MEYLLDTGEIELIERALRWLPVDGITVNPGIIAKTKREMLPLVKEMLEKFSGQLHVQVLRQDVEGIILQARELSSLNPDRLYVKIPVSRQGFAAMKVLNGSIKLSATSVVSVGQAVTAAKMGVDYVIPYVSRVDRLEQSGIDLIRDMLDAFDRYGFTTKVMPASVKSVPQVKALMEMGADAMTLPPALYEESLGHLLTDQAVDLFEEAWLETYTNLTLQAGLKA